MSDSLNRYMRRSGRFAPLRESPVLRGNDQGLVELVPPTFTKRTQHYMNRRFQDFRFEIESRSAVIDRRYSERKPSLAMCPRYPRNPRSNEITKRTHPLGARVQSF